MPGTTDKQKAYLEKMAIELLTISTFAQQLFVFVKSVKDYDDGFFTYKLIAVRKLVDNMVNTLRFEDGRTLLQYYLDSLQKESNEYGKLVAPKK